MIRVGSVVLFNAPTWCFSAQSWTVGSLRPAGERTAVPNRPHQLSGGSVVYRDVIKSGASLGGEYEAGGEHHCYSTDGRAGLRRHIHGRKQATVSQCWHPD